MRTLSQPATPAVSPKPAAVPVYARFTGDKLTPADGHANTLPPLAEFIHDSFRALVLNPRFACVAAKSAFQRDNYRFGVYDAHLGSEEATDALAAHLHTFIQEQDVELRERGFSTFVAAFTGPSIVDEEQFEWFLWDTLQRLHDRDTSPHPWDTVVSSDPNDPHFEWSFGGRAFFIVGLHPAASRLTRRFAFPTLVFNAHFQFDNLREGGKYDRMQEVIRGRDRTLQGTINPNLADFGERSDARQYSGRAVGDDWQCPFNASRVQELDAEESDAEGNLR